MLNLQGNSRPVLAFTLERRREFRSADTGSRRYGGRFPLPPIGNHPPRRSAAGRARLALAELPAGEAEARPPGRDPAPATRPPRLRA